MFIAFYFMLISNSKERHTGRPDLKQRWRWKHDFKRKHYDRKGHQSKQEWKKEAIVSEQVLLDKDGIKITLKGFEPKGLFGPSLKVLVENNTDGTIIVQTRDSAVNRVMVQTIFSCEVAGGKKANDQIIIMNSDLEQAGIEVIKDIELKFHIFDSQTWDTIFDSEAIMITTSADPSYV